jgi:hypothetical protein
MRRRSESLQGKRFGMVHQADASYRGPVSSTVTERTAPKRQGGADPLGRVGQDLARDLKTESRMLGSRNLKLSCKAWTSSLGAYADGG